MPPRTSLQAFLTTARSALSGPPAQRPSPLIFVVGNESADLDSICSALLFAYFRTHTPPHTLHIPLSNLPKADLALRPELNAVLNPAGLSPNDLITLSDLPRDGLDPRDTRWLLVDHNVLTGDLAGPFSDQIIGCVDHHDDEGAIPHSLPPDQPRIFAKCGSCMSLVLTHCQPTWDRLSTSSSAAAAADAASSAAIDAALAHVALAPILIDTTNLTSTDKTTACDRHAAALAEAKLQDAAAPARDRAAYFAQLTALKNAIGGLPYRDILRKDYKRWREGALTLGVSTVVQGLAYVLREVGDRAALLAALRAWAAEQGLDVAAVMTVSRPGGVFARELLVWGLNPDGVRAVRGFVDRCGATLGLESWEGAALDGGDGVGEWRVCWRQRGIEFSRKQVAPMLREAMRESSRL
ncbi:DHH phosphoesterase [Trichocladium antarcticum]|uniref:DHH phosphoesterase n=1 Tax=Trichocladium antarcticum TaxID=1450529 RepID=A0AAN6UD18_9PEZI|nr:DHH phosphoesterase [Trichocladium antarcticum]